MMLSAVTDPEGTKERQEHKLKRRIYHSKVCVCVCCVCACVCVCVIVYTNTHTWSYTEAFNIIIALQYNRMQCELKTQITEVF